MKILPLGFEGRAGTGYTHKVYIPYSDLTDTAALTKTTQIFPRSGDFQHPLLVRKVLTKVLTNFDGGATSSLTAEIGDGGDSARLLAAQEVHEDAATVQEKQNEPGHIYSSADGIDITWTATGANLDALVQGELEVYLDLQPMDDLKTPHAA